MTSRRNTSSVAGPYPHGTEPRPSQSATARRWCAATIILVIVAAVVMGWPTLKGTFVGGDDHRLVLNHVLVNHPSWSHALELFTIIHRDLYQPIPLLSFSLEFAIGYRFHLFDEGLSGGAWLFHLTNILLHAVNALLVWLLVVTWRVRSVAPGVNVRAVQVVSRARGRETGAASSVHATQAKRAFVARWADAWGRDAGRNAYAVAAIAALLFALHPLQVEVVAWVNGRMMLLSTLFALASLIALGRGLRDGRWHWMLWTILFVTACGMSKIRIGLFPLLILLPLARGYRITTRLVLLWLISGVIIGALLLLNIKATAGAGLFQSATEQLHGPRIARSLMAFAWYFQHYVWPTGLAPWYPTPGMVHWSDPAVFRACAIVIPCFALIVFAAWRSRVAMLGFAWFFVTMASTLPLIPTRNVLAADRYMYLPIVGLVWVTGLLIWKAYDAAVVRWRARSVRVVAGSLGVVLAISLVGMSWHVGSFYESFLKKTSRIAQLFPDSKYAWERVAWAYHSIGQKTEDEDARRRAFEQSVAMAKKELVHDDERLQSDAHVVMGLSQLKLGRVEEGLASMRRAVELNPGAATGALTKYNLAVALDDLGRFGESWPLMEEAVANMTNYNPGINRLAEAYRRLERPEDAVRMYTRALANNPYDVIATLGLAELDIQRATDESRRRAERRLRDLLEWMPENVTAQVNLGVTLAALGRTAEAIETYERALALDPDEPTAVLNLAQMYAAAEDIDRARPLFERVVEIGPGSIDRAVVVHDFFAGRGNPKKAVRMWSNMLQSPQFAGSVEVRGLLAWAEALAGDSTEAKAEATSLIEEGHDSALVRATLCYVAHAEERYDRAATEAEAYCRFDDPAGRVHGGLLSALESFDRRRPNVPWTFCLGAQLLICRDQPEPASLFINLCEEHCSDKSCHQRVKSLRAQLP